MTCFNVSAVLVLAIAVETAALAGEPCQPPMEGKTKFGVIVDYPKKVVTGSREAVRPGFAARYMQLRLRMTSDAPSWNVRLYDVDGRPLDATSSDMLGAERDWASRRLPVSEIDVDVEAGAAADGTEVARIVEYVAMPFSKEPQYYSTKVPNRPDWQVLHRQSERGVRVRAGEPVGMLVGSYGNNVDGHFVWTCSGVLVADRPKVLFVTAKHCGAPLQLSSLSWHADLLKRMTVDFSWDGDSLSREYLIAGPPILHPSEDLAVLELKPRDYPVPPPVPRLRDAGLNSAERLFIIHHPASDQKSISANCLALSTSEGVTGHDCDTSEGSSGAPVFSDATGEVVAIHVGGFEKRADGKCDLVNKGIPSNTLVRFLVEQNMAGYRIR